MSRFMKSSYLHHLRDNALPLCAVLVLASAAAAALSSCFFDTKTTLCEASGLRCRPGQTCAADQAACISAGGCGDGIRSGSEICDDGNVNDGDGCSKDCMSDETCGNGVVDEVKEERCDPAVPGTTNCSDECKLQVCGNRILDPDETCDDGNQVSGDGCSASCVSKEVCGNGIKDSAVGEDCDPLVVPFPMRPVDRLDCDSDCTSPVCGDGHTNSLANEQCDPGEVGKDSMACDKDCSLARCGDGYRNVEAGEECDDGTDNSSTVPDRCRVNCMNPRCGDDIIDDGEECDDGNDSNNDSCPTGMGGSCEPARCGDGFWKTEGTGRETCEKNGNLGCATGTTCNSFCGGCS